MNKNFAPGTRLFHNFVPGVSLSVKAFRPAPSFADCYLPDTTEVEEKERTK